MVLKGKRTLWEDAHHFSIGATQGYPHFHLDPNPHHYPTPNLHHHPGSDPHNPARFLMINLAQIQNLDPDLDSESHPVPH